MVDDIFIKMVCDYILFPVIVWNFKRAISVISNNTVNGEGIFISGMKKYIEYEFGRLVNVTWILPIFLKKLRISLERNGLALLEIG